MPAAEIDFRRVLDTFGDAVIAADADLTIVYANTASEHLLGWAAGELVGRSVVEIMPERLKAAQTEALRRFVSTSVQRLVGRTVRAPARRKDGQEIEVELTLNPYRLPSGTELLVGALRDLRDRVELERQYDIARFLRAATRTASQLTARLDLDCVVSTVVRELTDEFEAESARIWLYHAPTGVLRLEAKAGMSSSNDPPNDVPVEADAGNGSPIAEAARTRRPVVVEMPEVMKKDGVPSAPSMAAFPLLVAGELKGVLAAYFEKRLEREVIDVLEAFAAMVASALNDVALFAREQIARAEAEAARAHAEASERRYRFLAESIPQIVWTAEPDGRIDYVNQRWAEVTGMSNEAALGRGWEEAVHPTHRQRFLRRLAEARVHGEEFEIEFLLRGRDGRYCWELAHCVPFRGSDGTVLKWFGTLTDIDHRKRSEESQQFLTEASSIFVSSLEVGVMLSAVADLAIRTIADGCVFDVADQDGVLRRLVAKDARPSKAAAMDYIRSLEPSLPDSPMHKLLLTEHGVLITLVTPDLLAAAARDEEHRRALEVLEPVSAIAMPLRARGRSIGVLWLYVSDRARRYGVEELALVEDFAGRAALAIDNARLYTDAQRAVRLRDEFMSIASHELKTPLTPLKLQVARLRREMQRPEMRAKLDVVDRQVDRLTKLVNQLLDVSRITGGMLRLVPEPVNLTEVVESTLAELEDELKRCGSPIELKLDAPVVGSWDRLRIEQVVHNLLSNAIKYGQGRPLEVRLTSDGTTARLTVHDHGIGIEPQHLERIFGRFERAVSSRHFGGFGLGLWIVRQIVEASRGKIYVQSDPGAGSTFVVELPQNLAPPALGA